MEHKAKTFYCTACHNTEKHTVCNADSDIVWIKCAICGELAYPLSDYQINLPEKAEGQHWIIFDLKNLWPLSSLLDGKTVYFETWADAYAWLWETHCRDNSKYDKQKDVFADFRICEISLFESFAKPKMSDEERTILQLEHRAWDEGGLEEVLRNGINIPEEEIDRILAEKGVQKIGTAKGMPTADDYRSPFDINLTPVEFNGMPLNFPTYVQLSVFRDWWNRHRDSPAQDKPQCGQEPTTPETK